MRTAALLLVLLLAPTAAACTLRETPPGPGAFVLTDLADGTEWRVEVDGRALGGTCELSNHHALAGGWLAWIEAGRLRAQDVHADGPSVDLPIDADPFQVSLFDGTFVAVERHRISLIDLDTGAVEVLSLPGEDVLALRGELLAFRHGFADGVAGSTLSVYDARERAWLVRDRDMGELGARWWPWLLDDGWLVLHSEPEGATPRYHLLDLATPDAPLRDLALPPMTSTIALDEGWLYLRVMQRDGEWLDPHVLGRMPIGGGGIQDVAELRSDVSDVVDGLAVSPAYSAPRHAPLRLLSDAPAPTSAPLSSPPVITHAGPSVEPTHAIPFPSALAGLLVALAILRRFRRHAVT